jgi:predicted DNA-binding transcriptional regulator AlpA
MGAESLLYGKKLTTDEAAEALGITSGALRYWRSKGTGPRSLNIGGSVRYLEADLEAWLAQQNVA